jgi:hypothetical protein
MLHKWIRKLQAPSSCVTSSKCDSGSFNSCVFRSWTIITNSKVVRKWKSMTRRSEFSHLTFEIEFAERRVELHFRIKRRRIWLWRLCVTENKPEMTLPLPCAVHNAPIDLQSCFRLILSPCVSWRSARLLTWLKLLGEVWYWGFTFKVGGLIVFS